MGRGKLTQNKSPAARTIGALPVRPMRAPATGIAATPPAAIARRIHPNEPVPTPSPSFARGMCGTQPPVSTPCMKKTSATARRAERAGDRNFVRAVDRMGLPLEQRSAPFSKQGPRAGKRGERTRQFDRVPSSRVGDRVYPVESSQGNGRRPAVLERRTRRPHLGPVDMIGNLDTADPPRARAV